MNSHKFKNSFLCIKIYIECVIGFIYFQIHTFFYYIIEKHKLIMCSISLKMTIYFFKLFFAFVDPFKNHQQFNIFFFFVFFQFNLLLNSSNSNQFILCDDVTRKEPSIIFYFFHFPFFFTYI